MAKNADCNIEVCGGMPEEERKVSPAALTLVLSAILCAAIREHRAQCRFEAKVSIERTGLWVPSLGTDYSCLNNSQNNREYLEKGDSPGKICDEQLEVISNRL
jgi:hypothetical protein